MIETIPQLSDYLSTLRERLAKAFSPQTAYAPSLIAVTDKSPPSTGHCAVVALLVQGHCGGSLVRATVEGEEHWFNRVTIGGKQLDVDLTGDQYGRPEIQIHSANNLYGEAEVCSSAQFTPEALERCALLARRAGLEPTT